MREKVLAILDTIALIVIAFLWLVIEGVLLISWFSIMVYSIGGWIPLIIVNGLLVLAIVYYKKNKKYLRTSVACATIIGVLISGITFAGINSYSNDFTPDKWKNYPAGRDAMIQDLEEEHNLVGMSKDEIIELLGEPNNISQFLYGYETYEYYNHHTYGVGYRYLVNFGEDGIVTSTYYTFD